MATEFLDDEMETVSKKNAEILNKNYQANVYDIKKLKSIKLKLFTLKI
ncbi:MAG: hypothetical protein IAX21_08770 [Candidatus Bathyarchaeota archaeon]|nr:MAG: hypothetical protein IAX21_08770 [Candidatus Bathyarchaeota archaeon]